MRQTYLLVVAVALAILAGTWLLTSSADPPAKEVQPAVLADKVSKPLVPAPGPDSLVDPPPSVPGPELAKAPAALPAPPPIVPPPPPEVIEQARADFRRMVAARTQRDLATASFFRKLSPEKQRQLVDVIAQNETDFMQRLTDAAEKREILSETDLRSLRADGESAIKSVLGDSEYSEYQQHAAAAPDRIILAQTTEVLGKSLSEQSSQSLLTLLAEERQKLAESPPQEGQDLSRPIAAMAERVNARAAAVLISDQEREALQQVLAGLVEGASKAPPPR
jgi:hypothetical protein